MVLLVKLMPSTITMRMPNLIPPTQTPPNTPAVSTNTPRPTSTSTIILTDTPAPAFTQTFTPMPTSFSGPLPDLVVTGISDPMCIPKQIGTIFIFTIIVHNAGKASTYYFGPFNVDIFLILGETHYRLDEWASRFNGVIASSNLQIVNLAPNRDVALKLELDLKGNTEFAIEAIANSGANPIPESNTLNNKLGRHFSKYCY